MFTLNRMDFTTAPKPYRMGLLFTQQEWRIHTFSWRGGGSHPDPETRGGGCAPKQFCLAPWSSVWSKNKKGGRPLEHLPWIRH